jgi:MinD superfamily P-loop ATPase
MKEIVVLSGKGGTGKTSITAVFSALMDRVVLVDCDVDAANLHLLLHPAVEERHDFIGSAKARVNGNTCDGCGACASACRAGAIGLETVAIVDELHCEGCGLCAHLCPSQAISMDPHIGGRWFVSRTGHGPMFHARLSPGEDNSGKLVSTLRQAARVRAARYGANWILVDGPPGSGCPAISSLTGADYVILVTEPTISGYSDLQRAAAIADHFRVPTGIVINKADLNPAVARQIEDYAMATRRDILGRIDYDPAFTQAQRDGVLVLDTAGPLLRESLQGVWRSAENAVRRERSQLAILR